MEKAKQNADNGIKNKEGGPFGAIITDKEGNMHIMLGKVSFSNEDLAENVQTVIDTVIRVKPAAQKGTYIKKAVLHSVMGPAIHLAI